MVAVRLGTACFVPFIICQVGYLGYILVWFPETSPAAVAAAAATHGAHGGLRPSAGTVAANGKMAAVGAAADGKAPAVAPDSPDRRRMWSVLPPERRILLSSSPKGTATGAPVF
eukprot:SAG22_NODE_3249_length_1832_cov_1.412002_1_plen_114_part_00